MILITHIVAAAAVTKPVFQNPGLVFLLAVLSHYLLDAIPHWDYQLSSVKKDENNTFINATIIPNKKLLRNDLTKNLIDFLIGAAIIFLLIRPSLNAKDIAPVIALISGAILPDFITGLNLVWKKFPTMELTKFHHFIHTKNIRLNEKPLLGISLHLAIIAAVILVYLYS
ncbi:MAG: hypothetical protein AAB926_01075 [Patescibacteria group bacterium]